MTFVNILPKQEELNCVPTQVCWAQHSEVTHSLKYRNLSKYFCDWCKLKLVLRLMLMVQL